MPLTQLFADVASATAKTAGRPYAFLAAAVIVAGWAVAGPALHYSDTWQLIMNTVSSIITFLMVFLIQNTQERDSEAIHAKLDTLISALQAADARYIGVERLPDEDIEAMRATYGPAPAQPDAGPTSAGPGRSERPPRTEPASVRPGRPGERR